jgi:hypothetical protein
MIGGIVGCVLGVTGGVLGTYVGIRSASDPGARTFAIRVMASYWLWLAAVAAWAILMPLPWNTLAVTVTGLPLMAVPLLNRRLARAQAEDEADRIA